MSTWRIRGTCSSTTRAGRCVTLVDAAGARRVVHVGGAGCALARALAAGAAGAPAGGDRADPAVVAIARDHLGLRRTAGLRVRVGDGRATLARRPDGSADAVLVDAFDGALVPRHLVTAEALADIARVAGLAAVNVVSARPLGDAAAIGAGLRARSPHVLALGGTGVLAKRRGGNVVRRVPRPVRRSSSCARRWRRPVAGRAARPRRDRRVHRRRAAVVRRLTGARRHLVMAGMVRGCAIAPQSRSRREPSPRRRPRGCPDGPPRSSRSSARSATPRRAAGSRARTQSPTRSSRRGRTSAPSRCRRRPARRSASTPRTRRSTRSRGRA